MIKTVKSQVFRAFSAAGSLTQNIKITAGADYLSACGGICLYYEFACGLLMLKVKLNAQNLCSKTVAVVGKGQL